MKRAAFVTCSTKPGFAEDDLPAARLLESAGVAVSAIAWDSDFRDWRQFDAVVLRSTWNYHLHPDKFLRWLGVLQDQKVNLLNPASVVRWNLHKNYLLELSHKGIDLPPTAWLPKKSRVNLSDLLQQKRWDRAVVKPAISATAHRTILTSAAEASSHQQNLDSLLEEGDVLVQQFIAEVQTQGEWSLLFFNKKFSHAVLKKPKVEDFRVQDNYGGTAEALVPPGIAIRQSEKILGLVREPLLYARVDGIMCEGRFLLMELELIEPVLFLGLERNATGVFAKAILDALERPQLHKDTRTYKQPSTYR